MYSPLAILVGLRALDTDEVVDVIADDVEELEVGWNVTCENCRWSETIHMVAFLQHTDMAVTAVSGMEAVEVGIASEE